VSVALVIQHAKRMCRIVLSCMACPAMPYFSTLSHKRHDLLKKITEHKMCVLVFSMTFSVTFHTLRRIQRDITINVHRSSCKVPLFLSDFSKTWIFSTDFQKIIISNFMKIRPVGAEFFHVDGGTDRKTWRRRWSLFVIFQTRLITPIVTYD
jgi:hypothetical protein